MDRPHSLYIPRPELETVVKTWLEEPQHGNRLCSLIGPAGMGKAWFLKYFVYEHYANQKNYLVIWLDLRSKSDSGGTFFKDPGDRSDWLKATIQSVSGKLGKVVILYESSVTWSTMWDAFVRNLCRLVTIKIVLLVNGIDEVNDDQTRWFVQDQVVAPFISFPHTRAVLTRRDEWGLDHPYLRLNDYPIRTELHNKERRSLVECILERLKENPEWATILAQSVNFREPLLLPSEKKLKEFDRFPFTYLSGNIFVNNYILCEWLFNNEAPNENVVRAGISQLARQANLTESATQLLTNWQKSQSLNQITGEILSPDDSRMVELLQAGLAYFPPHRSTAKVHPSLLIGEQNIVEE